MLRLAILKNKPVRECVAAVKSMAFEKTSHFADDNILLLGVGQEFRVTRIVQCYYLGVPHFVAESLHCPRLKALPYSFQYAWNFLRAVSSHDVQAGGAS